MGSASKIQAHVQNCHISAWNLATQTGKSSKSCTYTLFLPHNVEIDLILALRAVVSEMQASFSKLRNLTSGQSARSCKYTLFPPWGSKFSLFLLYGQRFMRYGPIFKIAIFGMKNLASSISSKSCTHTLFLSQGSRNWAYFCSFGAISEIRANFKNKCHV